MSDVALSASRRPWQTPSVRFLALLLAYLIGFGVAYNEGVLRWYPEALLALTHFTAAVTHAVLGLVGLPASLHGDLVTYDGFTVRIIAECVGALEVLIFAACVLAYPTRWRDKALGLLIGVPAIYVFNVLRILCLLFVGRHLPVAFDFFHLYFWQATLIVMITSLFLLWLYVVVRR